MENDVKGMLEELTKVIPQLFAKLDKMLAELKKIAEALE